ncbi:MAG: hypothetical protein JNK45_25520 [Myxococcales bacterium]|nr:hypothetical protein [Myxococcales bacterium]
MLRDADIEAGPVGAHARSRSRSRGQLATGAGILAEDGRDSIGGVPFSRRFVPSPIHRGIDGRAMVLG